MNKQKSENQIKNELDILEQKFQSNEIDSNQFMDFQILVTHNLKDKFCFKTGRTYRYFAYNESENQAGMYHCSECGDIVQYP